MLVKLKMSFESDDIYSLLSSFMKRLILCWEAYDLAKEKGSYHCLMVVILKQVHTL
ncbi:MAG: hypothetical protein ACLRQF_17500 [Thomasclavelia ramosa]